MLRCFEVLPETAVSESCAGRFANLLGRGTGMLIPELAAEWYELDVPNRTLDVALGVLGVAWTGRVTV